MKFYLSGGMTRRQFTTARTRYRREHPVPPERQGKLMLGMFLILMLFAVANGCRHSFFF